MIKNENMQYFVGGHRAANRILEIKCSYFTLYLLAVMAQVCELLCGSAVGGSRFL